MSWDNLDAEILEEFAGASGRAREWFSAEGHSFQRLAKIHDDDLKRLGAVRATQKWRKAHPDWLREYNRRRRVERPALFRAKEKRYIERVKADPGRHAARKARAAGWARKKYHRLKSDPSLAQQWEAAAERNRRNARRYYHAHKNDVAYRDQRRERNAASARRMYALRKAGAR